MMYCFCIISQGVEGLKLSLPDFFLKLSFENLKTRDLDEAGLPGWQT